MEAPVKVSKVMALIHDLITAQSAIQRVRELHTKSVVNDGFPSQCTLCGYEYPCVTIKALDGEQ